MMKRLLLLLSQATPILALTLHTNLNRPNVKTVKTFNHRTSRQRNRFQFTARMALIPLPADETKELLEVGNPSGLQYSTYAGRTKFEKYEATLESTLLAFTGVFFSYCLSFVLGGFLCTLIGSTFAVLVAFSPDLKARQRNWEFLAGRNIVDPWMVEEGIVADADNAGLYGSILLGRIDDVCVVESSEATEEYDLDEFQDYTSGDDDLREMVGSPYLIRIRLSDDEGRELQIHSRLTEDYLGIEQGMPAAGILLSTSQSFSSLAAMTDIYIPDATCFVGDYPYLNRPEVEELFATDDDLWDTLMSQGFGGFSRI